MKLLLNNRQFSHGNKCVLKEKKVEMRKFIRELEKNKIVEQELFRNYIPHVSTLYGPYLEPVEFFSTGSGRPADIFVLTSKKPAKTGRFSHGIQPAKN